MTSRETGKAIAFVRPRLSGLAAGRSLHTRLVHLHRALRREFPAIDRVAVALHDRRSGRVKTYLASDLHPRHPLVNYETDLASASSLQRVFKERRIRVINDLAVFARGRHAHTRRIRAMGFRSSCTFPLIMKGRVVGFIFFNARLRGAFAPKDIPRLEVYARLVNELTTTGLRAAGILRAAVKTAGDLVHYRDPETGAHLDRMALFARLIAQEMSLSGRYHFDDERVQSIENFAPMHDVGKLAIPDRILLKRGPLTGPERRVMRMHSLLGRHMIDRIIRNFSLESFERIDLLRHIAEFHHESMDGQGYPRGLRGNKIPMESRIVAVADVFDAMTSARSYKKPWSNDRAFRALKKLSHSRLDRHCVQALITHRTAVERIQRRFRDKVSAGNRNS